MAETARVRAWIKAQLVGDATLQALSPTVGSRIFDTPPPAGTLYPFVIMELRSPGSDYLLLGGTTGWAEPLVLVKVITDKPSVGTIEPIERRIKQVLHLASGTVTNGTIWQCVRERPYDQPTPVEGGKTGRQLGGEYRIWASEA